MPYYKCRDDDGAGIFNIRSQLASDVPCGSLSECCESENIIPDHELPQFKVADSCGVQNVDGLGRFTFTRDNETQFGEFPWTMAVLKKKKIGNSHLMVYAAGGSLIHASVVLTTAHSMVDGLKESWIVRGGEWNTKSNEEMLIHEDRNVKSFVFHEKFSRANLQNDVALIFLETPFDFQPHINTVCMPPAVKYPPTTDRCLVMGWGKDKYGRDGVYQTFLKKIEVPLVDRDSCQSQLRKTRLGEDFNLHDGFICAGKFDDISS